MSLNLTPYIGLDSMELDLDLAMGEVGGIAPQWHADHQQPHGQNERAAARRPALRDGGPQANSRHQGIGQGRPGWATSPFWATCSAAKTNINRANDVVITITPHFYLASQINITTPPRVATLEKIVAGEAPLGLPKVEYGYDQWLLGEADTLTAAGPPKPPRRRTAGTGSGQDGGLSQPPGAGTALVV